MKNVKTGNAADIAGGIVWRSGQLVQVNEKSLSMPLTDVSLSMITEYFSDHTDSLHRALSLYLLQVVLSILIASLLFSISLVPHSVVDDTARASIPPTVRRLHARLQPYHVTSSYGLFRRMTGVGGRPEVVIEGERGLRDSEMARC